jgi:hypothetical protein
LTPLKINLADKVNAVTLFNIAQRTDRKIHVVFLHNVFKGDKNERIDREDVSGIYDDGVVRRTHFEY